MISIRMKKLDTSLFSPSTESRNTLLVLHYLLDHVHFLFIRDPDTLCMVLFVAVSVFMVEGGDKKHKKDEIMLKRRKNTIYVFFVVVVVVATS